MAIYPAIRRAISRAIRPVIGDSLDGGIAITDPTDPPPDDYGYLVDSSGNYLASRNSSWLIGKIVTPSAFTDELWMRASDLALADNDPISSWVSREGNSYDFAQATSGKQPIYKATSLLNSKPAVSFDGGDILRCATNVSTSNTGSVWVICRRSADTAYQVVFSQNIQGTGPSLSFYHRYDTAKLATDNSSSGATGQTSTQDHNDLAIWSSDGSVITMRLNGTDQTVTDGSSGKWFADEATTKSSIGGWAYNTDLFFFTGLIAEIGVCSSLLTPEQIAILENYANSRYGI